MADHHRGRRVPEDVTGPFSDSRCGPELVDPPPKVDRREVTAELQPLGRGRKELN